MGRTTKVAIELGKGFLQCWYDLIVIPPLGNLAFHVRILILHRAGHNWIGRVHEVHQLFLGLADDNESKDSQHRRANNLRTLAEIQQALGSRGEAFKYIDQSIALLKALDADDKYEQYRDDLRKSRDVWQALDRD